MLYIDATVIEWHKRESKRTCQKYSGYEPMVGYPSETEQVVAVVFRAGNVSPRAGHVRFVNRCQAALSDRVSVTRLRADAAGFQAALINYAREQQMGFAVRTGMDRQVDSYVLRTDPPLVAREQASRIIVRLACVKHAASVQSGLRSNSPFPCFPKEGKSLIEH